VLLFAASPVGATMWSGQTTTQSRPTPGTPTPQASEPEPADVNVKEWQPAQDWGETTSYSETWYKRIYWNVGRSVNHTWHIYQRMRQIGWNVVSYNNWMMANLIWVITQSVNYFMDFMQLYPRYAMYDVLDALLEIENNFAVWCIAHMPTFAIVESLTANPILAWVDYWLPFTALVAYIVCVAGAILLYISVLTVARWCKLTT
jgi:hypothetical protein